jgi:hypothetical protein
MGIAEKLRDYVLVPEHGDNNGKANGFAQRLEFEILGIGRYSDRKSMVRTIWHFQAAGDRPRLITAYLR